MFVKLLISITHDALLEFTNSDSKASPESRIFSLYLGHQGHARVACMTNVCSHLIQTKSCDRSTLNQIVCHTHYTLQCALRIIICTCPYARARAPFIMGGVSTRACVYSTYVYARVYCLYDYSKIKPYRPWP